MLDRSQHTPVQVIGIGLDGAVGLAPALSQLIGQATLLIGGERHLSYFPDHPAEKLVLTNFREAIEKIRMLLPAPLSDALSPPLPQIVVLTSGDPLFFGFGRLLLAELPADFLTFHPHVSAMQLAFSRIKQPWQDARFISAHGRSLDQLTQALQQGAEKIAVLTDGKNTPATIARLILNLQLPYAYQIWVCENLGGAAEQVQALPLEALLTQSFAHLNVVILLRLDPSDLPLSSLPLLGVADQQFLSFSDRPGLMTKREIRTLILTELMLQPPQVIWDIGSGTGSVAIELARLCPTSQIYAIEQTAVGINLIQKNCQRFQTANVTPIHSSAPEGLATLPKPDRIFVGGSGGNLTSILDACSQRLQPQGLMVLALATLEHLAYVMQWLETHAWQHQLLQIQLSRSTPIAHLTRFTPMNPVTLVTLHQTE